MFWKSDRSGLTHLALVQFQEIKNEEALSNNSVFYFSLYSVDGSMCIKMGVCACGAVRAGS